MGQDRHEAWKRISGKKYGVFKVEGVRERVVDVNVLTVHDIKIGGIKN